MKKEDLRIVYMGTPDFAVEALQCLVEKLENGGYNVSFSITDGSMTLMSFTVFMPDYSQVNLIKRSFYNDPQYIYTVLLAALTENREMIKDSLDKLIAK